MLDQGDHAARVDAWLERSATGLDAKALIALFESALAALWRRTVTTLGEVTLTAIADRVLLIASEKFPHLATLEVAPPSGIRCGALQAQVGSLPSTEVRAGFRFLLVEFLTVLGNLTGEVLSAELHAELAGVGVASAANPGDEDPKS